jgi:hypothetical protein
VPSLPISLCRSLPIGRWQKQKQKQKDFLLQKKLKHFYLVTFASASLFNGEKWLDNVII